MLYYIILYYIIIYIYIFYVNALYRENNEHLPDLRAQFVRNMQLYTKRTQVFMYHSPKKIALQTCRTQTCKTMWVCLKVGYPMKFDGLSK